jgi:S-(hydroxymethyl)glutathione dehydrogenase/alcohol dehydrogenase
MKTRAAVFWEAGRPLEVVDLELEDPRPGEVLVRMSAVGICGTDLHMVKGEWRRPTPMVLGHEGAGIVEAVGEGVTKVAPGDGVVLSWAPSCGECSDCRRRRPAACMSLQHAIAGGTLLDGHTGLTLASTGETVYRGTATGALSELLTVSEQVALPLGGGVPLDEAALLGCAALTGVGAVLFAARVEQESTVLVIGAGGVGQFVVQGARIAGASEVLCVDPLAERLELARRLGATRVTHPDDLGDLMKGVLPDGVDYAFDAVGDPSTTKLAFRWTRNGGLCVIVGLPAAGARLDLDPTEFIRREKMMTGTIYGSEDPAVALPILVDHVRSGSLDLSSQLGPSFALEDVNAAVEASLSGAPGRVIVKP